MRHQNVLPGAHNFVIKGSNLYSAQKVSSVTMVVVFQILIQYSSRLSFINTAAAFTMMHFQFPRSQIQVLYLLVVRILLRN